MIENEKLDDDNTIKNVNINIDDNDSELPSEKINKDNTNTNNNDNNDKQNKEDELNDSFYDESNDLKSSNKVDFSVILVGDSFPNLIKLKNV